MMNIKKASGMVHKGCQTIKTTELMKHWAANKNTTLDQGPFDVREYDTYNDKIVREPQFPNEAL